MSAYVSGKPQLNRSINASLLFSLIQREGPLSRADLAKRTGIRATSVSAIVQQLLDQKLLKVLGRGASTGGRHPILLDVNPSGLHAVGIELSEEALNGVVVDLSGRALAATRLPLAETSVEHVVDHCNALVGKLCGEANLARDQLSGLGVAVPGIVGRARGEVVLSRPLDWEHVPLERLLSERVGLDTHILNNAMAGATSVHFSPSFREVRSLLYVLVNLRPGHAGMITSLGCGIVLDGRPYFGEGEMAGELRVDVEHPLSTTQELLGPAAPTSLEALVKQSLADPARLAPSWQGFVRDLSRVIATGTDFLSPGRVVIGTDVKELEQLVGAPLLEQVRSHSVAGLIEGLWSEEEHGIRLSFDPVGSETIARGAILPRLLELSLAPVLRSSVLS